MLYAKEILMKNRKLWLPDEENVRCIVEAFCARVDQQQAITVGGIFNVNKSFAASVVSFIVTYVIILLQSGPNDCECAPTPQNRTELCINATFS